MSDSSALSVIGAVLLLLIAAFARRQLGALAPAAFFSAYWGVILLSTLLLTPDFYVWWGAVWLILVFAIAVHVGTVSGWSLAGLSTTSLRTPPDRCDVEYKLVAGPEILIGCTLLALLALPVILASRGYTVVDLFRPTMIISMARDYSEARYARGYDSPLVARLLTTFAFLGAAFSGLWLLTSRGWRRLLAILPFVPVTIQAMLLTTRATLLFPVFLCAGSYLSAAVLRRTRVRLWSVRGLIGLATAVVLAIGVFVALQMLRDALTLETISTAWDKARVSFFGSPAVFSRWFEREWMVDRSPTWGAYNVAGIFEILGLGQRQQGLYAVALPVGSQGQTSNVYTSFRALIDDFTVLGALGICFGFGVAAGFCHRKVLSGRRFYVPVLALFYGFVLASPLTSLFNYNTVVLACGLFVAIMWFGRILREVPA